MSKEDPGKGKESYSIDAANYISWAIAGGENLDSVGIGRESIQVLEPGSSPEFLQKYIFSQVNQGTSDH